MELITLASSAIGLAMPYLVKTGESIAEEVGKDIWNLVKSIFGSSEENSVQEQLVTGENNDEIIQLLIDKLSENLVLKNQLETAVLKAQDQLSINQTINNNGTIDKQININQNSGNIQM